MANYYKHSGKFSPHGPIMGLFGGIAVSVPAAFLYNFAIFSVPGAKARFLCTIVFGLLLGGVCGAMMCLGKVRSKLVAGIVAFASSLAGLYVSWLAWILHLMYPSHWVLNIIPAALRPLQFWKAVLAVNLSGTWGFAGGTPVHGAALWLVWAGEALLVLGFGVLGAVALVQKRPFCERCEQWCTKSKLYFAPALPCEDFKIQLESGDVSELEKLPSGNKKQAHYRIDLHTCGVCQQLNTVSLEQSFPRPKVVVNKLILTPEQASVIRNIEMNQRAASTTSAIPASAK